MSCIIVEVPMVVWQETAGYSVMYNGRGPYGGMAGD